MRNRIRKCKSSDFYKERSHSYAAPGWHCSLSSCAVVSLMVALVSRMFSTQRAGSRVPRHRSIHPLLAAQDRCAHTRCETSLTMASVAVDHGIGSDMDLELSVGQFAFRQQQCCMKFVMTCREEFGHAWPFKGLNTNVYFCTVAADTSDTRRKRGACSSSSFTVCLLHGGVVCLKDLVHETASRL